MRRRLYRCSRMPTCITSLTSGLNGGGAGGRVETCGSGPHIWDADGREYVDYMLGSGSPSLARRIRASWRRCRSRQRSGPRPTRCVSR